MSITNISLELYYDNNKRYHTENTLAILNYVVFSKSYPSTRYANEQNEFNIHNIM